MSEFVEIKFMGNYLLEVLSHNEFFSAFIIIALIKIYFVGISEDLTRIFQILDNNLALVRHQLMDTKGFISLKIPSCFLNPTAII